MIYSYVAGVENNQATYYDLKVHWALKDTHMSLEFTTRA
jgi:hypothetical protein